MATDKEQAGDHPTDDIESVEEEETGQNLVNIMKLPNMMATLQSQQIAEMLANLPLNVKKRIKALKNLQLETTNIEAKFFKEVHELECKYHKMYVPLYEKRNKIVNGDYEPTESESQWPSDDEEDISNELKEKAQIQKKDDVNVKGVPDFWLTIFKNCTILAEMVQPHDEPILKHLIDIKSNCEADPMVFTLEFHFSPNEFFTNSVLTKEYSMKCVPDEDDPFSFEGPEIYKCTGCVINWNKGKNVTLKTIKKKQKHKNRGIIRTVTKTVGNDSFFNFFSPPVIPDEPKDEDDDIHSILTSDFEIGHFIRERIIPKAVLYFTGEGIDDEEDYEEEEDDEEDDEEENDSDDGGKERKSDEKDPNCKQQ